MRQEATDGCRTVQNGTVPPRYGTAGHGFAAQWQSKNTRREGGKMKVACWVAAVKAYHLIKLLKSDVVQDDKAREYALQYAKEIHWVLSTTMKREFPDWAEGPEFEVQEAPANGDNAEGAVAQAQGSS